MNCRKVIVFTCLCAFLIHAQGQVHYYFDSRNGSDANSGLSPLQPKRTIAAVKAVLTSLPDGSSLNFAAGSHWFGVDNLLLTGRSNITLQTYGQGKPAKLWAMEDFSGTFTNVGANLWRTTITGAPTGGLLSIPQYNTWWAGVQYPYHYTVNQLSLIRIDSCNYSVSVYPDDDGYLTIASVASDQASWFTLKESVPQGFFSGAVGSCAIEKWCMAQARITEHNSVINWTVSDLGQNNTLSKQATVDDWGMGLKVCFSNFPNGLSRNGEFYYNTANGEITIYWEGNLNERIVHLPVASTLFKALECSNITLKNLEFAGGIVESVVFAGCTGTMLLDSCIVTNTGVNGLYFDRCQNVTVRNSTITQSINSGILWYECTGALLAHNNYVDNIGVFKGMGKGCGNGRTGFHFIGISSWRRTGSLAIYENMVTNCGYMGIMDVSAATSNPANIYHNYVKDAMVRIGDGGNFYSFKGTSFLAYNPTGQFRNNISRNTRYNPNFFWDGDQGAAAYYLDENSRYWSIDSCVAYGFDSYGIKLNGARDNTFTNNLAVTVRPNTAGITFNDNAINTDTYDQDNTFAYNTLVYTNTTAPAIIVYNPDSPITDRNNTFNNNIYMNPLLNNNIVADNFVNYTTHNYLTLTSWRAAIQDDANSVYNPGNVTVDGSDQVVFLSNYSRTATSFDLKDCRFRDVNGTLISGSVSVPRFYGKVLFFESGDSLAYVQDDFRDFSLAPMSGLKAILPGTVVPHPTNQPECAYRIQRTETRMVGDSARWDFNGNLNATYGTTKINGIAVYENTWNCTQGLHESSGTLTINAIDLADSFRIFMDYTSWQTTSGAVLASNKAEGSGWQLRRRTNYSLEFVTEDAFGNINSSISNSNVILGDGTCRTIEVIVSRKNSYASILVNGRYVTSSDSSIEKDFNTAGSISLAGDLGGGNKPWSYFGSFQINWSHSEVVSIDSCVPFNGYLKYQLFRNNQPIQPLHHYQPDQRWRMRPSHNLSPISYTGYEGFRTKTQGTYTGHNQPMILIVESLSTACPTFGVRSGTYHDENSGLTALLGRVPNLHG